MARTAARTAYADLHCDLDMLSLLGHLAVMPGAPGSPSTRGVTARGVFPATATGR
jgi:hypothetical protein